MEGPAFSTKESHLYHSWGAVIGILPEAKLARSGNRLCDLSPGNGLRLLASDHDSVTVEMVIANLQRTINAQKVIQETVRRLSDNPPRSDAHSALKYAILLADKVPVAKRKLGFVTKYLV